MTPEIFKYLLTFSYLVLVLWLSFIGMRRTTDLASFAIGDKQFSPYLIGLTLSASIASTATFVINPGFIYVHGFSAFFHFGIAASGGILTAFLVLTRGFLKFGTSSNAVTIPQWVYHRYQSGELRLFFAVINLLSIAFVVLILVGCSLLVSGMFPVSQKLALVLVMLFVFSYVLTGGTYAHAYTNALQGGMMLLIAIFLFADGIGTMGDGFVSSLRAVGPDFASVFNPSSDLYYDFFSVFVSGFVVTFALMLQPHILTKILYLREPSDINKFIWTTVLVGFGFSLILMIGFFARFSGLEIPMQDQVVRDYLVFRFMGTEAGAYLLTFIFLTLLAAGMSTLDGILVSLSAMVINDIVVPLTGRADQGLMFSRIFLIALGLVGVALAWNPPALVGLFAQKGVYGLAAASAAPILIGVLYTKPIPAWIALSSAFVGLFTHLALNLGYGVSNPAVSATLAIFASFAVFGTGLLLNKTRQA